MKSLAGIVNQRNVYEAAEALNENLGHIPRHSFELTLFRIDFALGGYKSLRSWCAQKDSNLRPIDS
jgi:hypothetical protein